MCYVFPLLQCLPQHIQSTGLDSPATYKALVCSHHRLEVEEEKSFKAIFCYITRLRLACVRGTVFKLIKSTNPGLAAHNSDSGTGRHIFLSLRPASQWVPDQLSLCNVTRQINKRPPTINNETIQSMTVTNLSQSLKSKGIFDSQII